MPLAHAPRILVVEDHAALREQIVWVLAADGWRVEEASDGRAALQMALEQPPDVLLLDLGLPGLDGLALCETLRAHRVCRWRIKPASLSRPRRW